MTQPLGKNLYECIHWDEPLVGFVSIYWSILTDDHLNFSAEINREQRG